REVDPVEGRNHSASGRVSLGESFDPYWSGCHSLQTLLRPCRLLTHDQETVDCVNLCVKERRRCRSTTLSSPCSNRVRATATSSARSSRRRSDRSGATS